MKAKGKTPTRATYVIHDAKTAKQLGIPQKTKVQPMPAKSKGRPRGR